MRTVGDTELQARFLNEMIEANEKKRKLEAALAALDTQYQLLIESAARKDIQVYIRNLLRMPTLPAPK